MPERPSHFKMILMKLRKRHIIETLAAFIGGGWLLVEVVERLLVGHYKFPEETIDLTVVSVIGALLSTLVWRWFSGTEKRPGNIKIEVLLAPMIILVTLAIDLNLILQIASIPDKKLLIGIVAFMLGIAWVIFKLSQWAASTPDAAAKTFDISKLAEIKPEKSIVVLPFVNISPEEGQDYFCDGMTEEIITDLSHLRDLLVISRSSAMTFKGTQKTIPEIARAVNVRYVLEGSVRKAGNDLRIAAQLIDATSDTHLWAEKFGGTLDDVFDIQEKVACSIVEALRLKLTPEVSLKIFARPIDNIAAYELYLRAHQEIWKFNEKALDQSLQYLQQALDIVGDNALLFSTMAYVYWQHVNIGAEQEEYLKRAEVYVKKALALDPDCSQAHAVMGFILFWVDYREATRHFRMALAVNPDEIVALHGLASFLAMIGKKSDALSISERLMQIDPLSVPSKWIQGALHFYSGEYAMALEPFCRFYKTEPENPAPQLYYAWALAYNNNLNEAFSLINQITTGTPENVMIQQGRMLKYALLKDKEKVLEELTPDFHKTCWRDLEFSHTIADMLAFVDARKEALDWIENAVDRGFINYPLLTEKDPFLANIRGEPRFKKLMKRVKYEWEHFEV